MKPLIFSQIYRDRFITFGGLISSKILTAELGQKASGIKWDQRTLLKTFSGKGKEPQIQERLESFITKTFTDVSFKAYANKRDILILSPQPSIIEIKHNHSDTPDELDDLRGSPTTITAVQQLHKYLLTGTPNIGVLTDGMSVRIYHCKKKRTLDGKDLADQLAEFSFEPYIEFSVPDIVLAKRYAYLDLLFRLIFEPGYLIELIERSEKEKLDLEEDCLKKISEQIMLAHEKYPDLLNGLLAYTSTIGAIRVLEDHGIFDLLPSVRGKASYKDMALSNTAFSDKTVLKCIQSFFKGQYLKLGGKDFALIKKYDDKSVTLDVSDEIEKLLKNKNGIYYAKNIHGILSPIDCSQLDWNFWSVLYQINANKEDKKARFGRYYTHPQIIANIVEWFVEKEQKATRDEKNLPIYDPCVGSGNMLRTFLSFSIRLEPGSASPVEAAREMVAHRLWGSDIDDVAIWISRLSLATSVAVKGLPLCWPRTFHMDVFDNAGWKKVTRDQHQQFSIVSNPPWKRPKFQLNYAFRDLFATGVLPKQNTKLYLPYEKFKEIVAFGKKSSTQYYKLWQKIDSPALLSIEEKKLVQDSGKEFSKLSKSLGKNLSLVSAIREMNSQLEEVESQKNRFIENYDSSSEDSADKSIGDRSCAAMFLSRMIRGIGVGSKFAIVQPDSFFVGDTEERRDHFQTFERYFAFSKNRIPNSKKPIFSEVHSGTKFGVVLGTKGFKSSSLKCTIFRTDLANTEAVSEFDDIATEEIVVSKEITKRAGYFMMPLFDRKEAALHLLNWIKKHKCLIDGEFRWRDGIHQTQSKRTTSGTAYWVGGGKSVKPTGKMFVFKFLNSAHNPSKYEKRKIPDTVLKSQKTSQLRVFVSGINRTESKRHSCLVTGLIPKKVPVFDNVCWLAPKSANGALKQIATKSYESALYVIAKSNRINSLTLNWLGF